MQFISEAALHIRRCMSCTRGVFTGGYTAHGLECIVNIVTMDPLHTRRIIAGLQSPGATYQHMLSTFGCYGFRKTLCAH